MFTHGPYLKRIHIFIYIWIHGTADQQAPDFLYWFTILFVLPLFICDSWCTVLDHHLDSWFICDSCSVLNHHLFWFMVQYCDANEYKGYIAQKGICLCEADDLDALCNLACRKAQHNTIQFVCAGAPTEVHLQVSDSNGNVIVSFASWFLFTHL